MRLGCNLNSNFNWKKLSKNQQRLQWSRRLDDPEKNSEQKRFLRKKFRLPVSKNQQIWAIFTFVLTRRHPKPLWEKLTGNSASKTFDNWWICISNWLPRMSMLRKEEKTFVDLFLVLSKVVLFSELKRYLLPDNNREKTSKSSQKNALFLFCQRYKGTSLWFSYG